MSLDDLPLDSKDGLLSVEDYIYERNFRTIVTNQPMPGRSFFSIMDNHNKINQGKTWLMIKTVDGKRAVRQVHRVDGTVVILKEPLNHPPIVGGEVLMVMGKLDTVIDEKATARLYNKRNRTVFYR